MSKPSMSADPLDRIGIYKRLEQIPEHYQLSNYASAYENRDVWGEYVGKEVPEDRAERFMKNTERTERCWKSHMDSCNRHHALATPADVEQWCEWLCNEFSVSHAYDPYWCRVEEFYSYLEWHTDHPHAYNPFLMAAAEYPAAGQIWAEKTNSLKWVR